MKNSMKTPDQKKRSKQLGKEIRDSKKRYEDLRVHGGSDPFWSDGVNMNLCRNHVMYFRKQVETELDPENYPEEYFLEIPAEVSVHYMADPDGIRSRSTAALEVLKENQDFQYLRSKLSGDLDKETSQCMNPVRYVLGMEDAIRRDDLVVMRRCQDPDPIEEKAMQILETAKPVPIQIPERLFDKERIKELEKDLIRAEAERDVFQKLYKEQLAIS